MTSNNQTNPDKLLGDISQEVTATEKILCPHCQRTATNGISCKGICVADSDY